MKNLFTTLLFLSCCAIGMAQSTVRYDVEPAVNTIQEDYISTWSKINEINGYRIQIAAITGANSKTTAESERLVFQSRFPETTAYVSYLEPYFRIRVGNFHSRIEAYHALLEIQSMYPNAYIVPEKITYSE